jgi:serine-type D-Ala-D-Ala carboxypeptidase (penicillin-binding protein 5/6)
MNKTTCPHPVPLLVSLCAAAILLSAPWCPAAKIPDIYANPYIGAIAVDGATGKVLFEENADVPGYPASCVKLMDLLVIVEQVETGKLNLTNKVTITAQAMRMGGSQAFLEEGEVFTVDELLYALIVMSGNDAAVALALHVAGSTEAFVELMNRRAKALGMKDTVFSSVHGLPPPATTDQQPDVSTARDLAVLAREVIRHPGAMKYASTQVSTGSRPGGSTRAAIPW